MMPAHRILSLALTLSAAGFVASCARVPVPVRESAGTRRLSITDHGAVADGTTLNTRPVQAAIDRLAAEGGGTLVVPAGVFVSGALFFKPGVNLHLEKDAVLRCSTDMANFPPRRTRIEGRFQVFPPALVNVHGCDGFRLDGEGTLDGAGRPLWDEFWRRRRAAPDPKEFANIGVARARLALIENSRGVVVDRVTFKDSQFWNLHLYRCREVLVQNARFLVPDDYPQAPSTDGIDVDSSRDVTIRGCYFSVTDDCVAMKGSKGPLALEDRDSPPVERVRVVGCHFRRGHAAVTFGSEATVVRDVVVENCRVTGAMSVLNFKLRPDTPQRYEDIHCRGLELDHGGGALVSIHPWRQYADLQGLPPPRSTVSKVTVSGVRGRYGAFGSIEGNAEQSTFESITFKDVDLRLAKPRLAAKDFRAIRFEAVTVNGETLAPAP